MISFRLLWGWGWGRKNLFFERGTLLSAFVMFQFSRFGKLFWFFDNLFLCWLHSLLENKIAVREYFPLPLEIEINPRKYRVNIRTGYFKLLVDI
jgi:hypothetical protein